MPDKKKRRLMWGIIPAVLCVTGIIVFAWKSGMSERSAFKGQDLTQIVTGREQDGAMPENRNIVCIGNAAFADGRDSTEDIGALLEQKGNITVSNVAFSHAYAAAKEPMFAPSYPFDAFSFYWMTVAYAFPGMAYTVDGKTAFDIAFENMKPVSDELYGLAENIQDINRQQIDTIVIMYDAADYIAGKPLENPENETDIQTFGGALNAGIQMLQSTYPDAEIVLVSPPYAYSPDELGKYHDSDRYRYGEAFLYDYVLEAAKIAGQNQITFIDVYCLTAGKAEYLNDYIHLSPDGRKVIADRIYEVLLK